ncbi:MAG: YggT family protein [Peptococcaceae bacterium]|nr:YggT family protein [Peptococcaceae bacterium]
MKISTLFWIYRVTDMVFSILEWAIIIRCFLSWIPHSPQNPLIRVVYDVTEPILKPFRAIRIGGAGGMIDFSPIFAVLALMLIRSFVLAPIFNLIARF